MTDVHVRFLTPDDWEIFRGARLRALQENPAAYLRSYADEVGQDDAYWRETLDGQGKCVVGLFDGEKLCGFGAVFPWHSDLSGQTGVMAMDYIDPDHRGRHLSRLLYQARIEWALKQPQFKKLIISHRDGNEASRRANQAFGFQYCGREKITWPDGQEAEEWSYSLTLKDLKPI